MHQKRTQDLILDAVSMRALLSGVVDQRGKIARMLEKGELISLRRGLYATRHDLDPRCLAGPIYGPSYVSFETALSWYGMIPENVAEIRSATIKRAAHFENAFGRFTYLPIPRKVFPIGITRITTTPLPFLLASPTKALADRIAQEPGFRSMTDIGKWLTMMRIELRDDLNTEELTQCAADYGRPSVRWLLRFAQHNHLLFR